MSESDLSAAAKRCTWRPIFPVGAVAALWLVGCAGTLSQFQPAHVGQKGTIRAEGGLDVALPSSAVGATIDAAKSLAASSRERPLNENERLSLYVAALTLAVNPPAVVGHFAASYNPADDWELAVRYAGGSLRAGVRTQLIDQRTHGFDLSVGVGITRLGLGFPIENLLDVVRVEGYERWTIDVPILFGTHGAFHRLWGGPRLAWVHHSAGFAYRPSSQNGMPQPEEVARESGSARIFGATGGAALGYRAVFLGVELTVVHMSGEASLDVFGRAARADTGSWIVTPGFAVMGDF